LIRRMRESAMSKECCNNKCCSLVINTMGVLGIMASITVIILFFI
jgi:hypothetical protein